MGSGALQRLPAEFAYAAAGDRTEAGKLLEEARKTAQRAASGRLRGEVQQVAYSLRL